MPVSLCISQIRNELFRTYEREDAGDGLGAVLGQWFHRLFATLAGPDGMPQTLAALADADRCPDAWSKALEELAYRQFVGPKLSSEQAAWSSRATNILVFWQAVGSLARWLGGILWTTHEQGFWSVEELPAACARWGQLCFVEQPLFCVLRQPRWSESVRLAGTADAVLAIPRTERWCVVELKLASRTPEIDLAQACLYRWMLQAQRPQAARVETSVCLVAFTPTVVERMFSHEELAEVEQRLVHWIGKLAGVAGSGSFGTVAPVRGGGARPEQPPLDETSERRGSAATAISTTGVSHTAAPRDAALRQPREAPREAHRELGCRLIAGLREYGAAAEPAGEPIVGPSFVRYPILPARGVRIAAIKQACDNLPVRLGLEYPLTTTLSFGQLYIDMPRPDRRMVPFSEIVPALPAPDPLFGASRLPVGVDIAGNLRFADFAEPGHGHVLVAGTTGSGKTEWLRAALAGLILSNTPETLRLLLIDPKRSAFHELRSSPFLWDRLGVVYPDEVSATEAFARLGEEMNERYRQMEGCDQLVDFVRRRGKPIPRIVCVCDEYFDLITRPPKKERQELEEHIYRLGAKARAAGIHLILATQQPSRQTIKGALDANIPCRVGLRMQSPLESRMLLHVAGAERLLGRGDLLFKAIGDPVRLQSPYLSEAERRRYFAEE